MTSPLISVIIPVYNVEKHLRRCLDSLQAQTFANFEAILVDDGSSDTSGLICDEYARKDKRFKVYHTTNRGVSAARNLALSNISGKYFTFIDSDDAIEQNYLELLLSPSDSADMVISGIKFTAPNGDRIKEESYIPEQIEPGVDFPYHIFDNEIYLYSVSKRYKKNLLNLSNLSFDSTLDMGEDTLFIIQYLKLCKKIIILEGSPYLYYRYGSGTLSSRRHDTYKRIDAANAKISTFLEHWQPGAGSTPGMKRRFWLSFYYASFYTLQDSNTEFIAQLNQLKEIFSRSQNFLSFRDIWSMTHMELPIFRFFLSLRLPSMLIIAYHSLQRLKQIKTTLRQSQ